MIINDVVQQLGLQIVAGNARLERVLTGGYSADLLSCVMGHAKAGNIWITLQAHPNVIAVATLLDLGAVIVTEGTPVPDDVRARADAEGIVLLATSHTTFWVVGELAKLGVPAQE